MEKGGKKEERFLVSQVVKRQKEKKLKIQEKKSVLSFSEGGRGRGNLQGTL